jgi:hypothetical protein
MCGNPRRFTGEVTQQEMRAAFGFEESVPCAILDETKCPL